MRFLNEGKKERSKDLSNNRRRDAKEHRMSLLWIILIVVLVLALLGFFGRGRF